MQIVLVILASIVPAGLMYLWLRSQKKEEPAYEKTCRKAFLNGVWSALPIMGMDLGLSIVGGIVGINKLHPIAVDFFETFFLFALVEELGKFLAFKKTLKKADYAYSRLDVITFMTIVGAGFGILEDVVYAFITSPGQGLVRGLTMMHAVFGFIMGYFYSRGLQSGKKSDFVLAFLLPYLYHALYDFCLSDKLPEDAFIFAFTAVSLAVLALVMVPIMIRFFKKSRSKTEYTEPLNRTQDA
jgi:RsiW-degrading membrane proteinase PrsW (M82 family)